MTLIFYFLLFLGIVSFPFATLSGSGSGSGSNVSEVKVVKVKISLETLRNTYYEIVDKTDISVDLTISAIQKVFELQGVHRFIDTSSTDSSFKALHLLAEGILMDLSRETLKYNLKKENDYAACFVHFKRVVFLIYDCHVSDIPISLSVSMREIFIEFFFRYSIQYFDRTTIALEQLSKNVSDDSILVALKRFVKHYDPLLNEMPIIVIDINSIERRTKYIEIIRQFHIKIIKSSSLTKSDPKYHTNRAAVISMILNLDDFDPVLDVLLEFVQDIDHKIFLKFGNDIDTLVRVFKSVKAGSSLFLKYVISLFLNETDILDLTQEDYVLYGRILTVIKTNHGGDFDFFFNYYSPQCKCKIREIFTELETFEDIKNTALFCQDLSNILKSDDLEKLERLDACLLDLTGPKIAILQQYSENFITETFEIIIESFNGCCEMQPEQDGLIVKSLRFPVEKYKVLVSALHLIYSKSIFTNSSFKMICVIIEFFLGKVSGSIQSVSCTGTIDEYSRTVMYNLIKLIEKNLFPITEESFERMFIYLQQSTFTPILNMNLIVSEYLKTADSISSVKFALKMSLKCQFYSPLVFVEFLLSLMTNSLSVKYDFIKELFEFLSQARVLDIIQVESLERLIHQ